MALYVISGIWNKPKAYKLCENVLAVEVKQCIKCIEYYNIESCRCLGFSNILHIYSPKIPHHLYTSSPLSIIHFFSFWTRILWTFCHRCKLRSKQMFPRSENMQFFSGCKIAGIHNGKLTMYSDKNMITVQLPNGYVSNLVPYILKHKLFFQFVDDETKNRITENDRKILVCEIIKSTRNT